MQADFSYGSGQADNAAPARAISLVVSIFADRPHVRAQMLDDCVAAGMRIGTVGGIELLLDDDAMPLGEAILLDCPESSALTSAALCRLDVRAAHSDAQLVVSTSVDALDEVFACLDQSEPCILVDPGRADRVIALGRVLARATSLRVRELTEDDRLTLLRLTEQVGQIAQRLDGGALRPAHGHVKGDAAFRFESPVRSFNGQNGGVGGGRLAHTARPSFPDPRVVRKMIGARQMRSRFFDAELFADPAWDMLLDLTAAKGEKTQVSVTSLCIASAVPPTTALRWISQMTEAGLLMRVDDKSDKRRAFITLTEKAVEGMSRYFAELQQNAPQFA